MQKGDDGASPSTDGHDKRLGSVSDIVSPGGTSYLVQEQGEGSQASGGQQLQTQGRLDLVTRVTVAVN